MELKKQKSNFNHKKARRKSLPELINNLHQEERSNQNPAYSQISMDKKSTIQFTFRYNCNFHQM